MSNIYEKLQAARVELQNKKLKKSGKNKFAGFEYFELSDFLPTINEMFQRYKLISIFTMDNVVATLNIINAENPEEHIPFFMPTAELELKGCNKLQAQGGVNTYLRRYLYLNALEIVEADLFDAEAGKETVKAKVEKPEDDNKFIDDSDFDLIMGLSSIEDMVNLEKYYKENFDKAKDKSAFNHATNERKKVLKGVA